MLYEHIVCDDVHIDSTGTGGVVTRAGYGLPDGGVVHCEGRELILRNELTNSVFIHVKYKLLCLKTIVSSRQNNKLTKLVDCAHDLVPFPVDSDC